MLPEMWVLKFCIACTGGETHHFILGIAQRAQKNQWKSQGHLNSTHGKPVGSWGGIAGSGVGAHIPEWFWWHAVRSRREKSVPKPSSGLGLPPTIQTVSLRDGACFQTSP